MKVTIIGYSGAGKSTLAKILSEHYNCPVMYLDTVNFLPNWNERDTEEGKSIVEEFLTNENWVIDGNYKKFSQQRRLDEADTIIFLNYPRRICLYQALRRYYTYKGKTRESAANGCIEKFDFEFLKWILFDGRNSHYKAHYKQVAQIYQDKIVILRNRKQLNQYLEKIMA